MKEAEGKFFRQYQRKGYFARVTVRVAADRSVNGVECAPDCITGLYDDWRHGAVAGAQYALRVARCEDLHVEVADIGGVEVDTNPTVVGVAAADAVWRAIGFTPDAEETARMERAALTSWERGYNAPPDFGA